MRGILGVLAFLAIAWILSENRGQIRWRTVIGGFLLQFLFAGLLIAVPLAQRVLRLFTHLTDLLQAATDTGTGFLFGYLGGAPLPFHELNPGSSFILAFKALPLVLVISALSALLFRWGALQAIAGIFAWLLKRSLGIGGALAIGAAVHIFVGMIEAPLLIRPWLDRMQRGEIFALMSCGLAGIAGTVMVIYASMLAPVLPDALGNILAASVISTPAAFAIAAMMVPFAPGEDSATLKDDSSSSLDALVRGTLGGIQPLVGIGAVLIVTIAVVTLINGALGYIPTGGDGGLTLQAIFARLFQPLVWLCGIEWAESGTAAHLMASKTVLNEFVAYRELAGLPGDALSARSKMIMTYALCGFANFGSLGILIGGLGTMIPGRRAEVVQLGFRAILAGTLATLSSGAVAGMFYS